MVTPVGGSVEVVKSLWEMDLGNGLSHFWFTKSYIFKEMSAIFSPFLFRTLLPTIKNDLFVSVGSYLKEIKNQFHEKYHYR